jgi:hypothetical protein
LVLVDIYVYRYWHQLILVLVNRHWLRLALVRWHQLGLGSVHIGVS